MSYLFLDDLRSPDNDDWHVVTNYLDFVDYILNNDMPVVISMDHDLGTIKDGYDCIKFLVHHIVDNYIMKDIDISLPVVLVHSKNPVGRENIERYWQGFVINLLAKRFMP